MSLLLVLALAGGGAAISLALRRRRWAGTLVGMGAVLVVLVALAAAPATAPLVVAGSAIALTEYARILLGVALAGGVLVLGISRLATWEASGPGVLLLATAGVALAVGAAGIPAGILAALATAVLTGAAALARAGDPLGARALARELRGAAVAAVVLLVAVALAPEGIGGLAVQPQVAGLAAVAAGLALGHRFGTIPLHARVARLTDAAPASTLPVLLALVPAGWTVVVLAWAPDTLGPAAPVLGWDGALLVAIGVATLVLGTLAALIQDDLLRVVAYTVVLDAGVVVLGYASLDPAGRDAVRAWLVPFVASRTALVGWTIAFRAAFASGRLGETRGWLRRSPILGVALVGIGVAAVGWPGLLVWDARLEALRSSTAGLVLAVATIASFGTALAIARILGAGFGRPEARVLAAPGELARVPAGLRAAARAMRAPEGRRMAVVRAAAREARPLLDLNRTPLRALATVLLAGLALMTAAGAFGIREAASGADVPVPAPVEPTPDLPPLATPSPEPEEAPAEASSTPLPTEGAPAETPPDDGSSAPLPTESAPSGTPTP